MTKITVDLASILTLEFKDICVLYGLRVVAVDEMEALLIGQRYALRFSADHDGLDVSYIEQNSTTDRLDVFTLRPLVMQRFTAADRDHYGKPTKLSDRLAASVRVYAAGLANRCADVLAGEKSWLNRTAWAAAKLPLSVDSIVRNAGVTS